MAASVAIHSLFIFWLWNRPGLPAGTVQTAEVSIELVTAPPSVAGNQPQKSASVADMPPQSAATPVRKHGELHAPEPDTVKARITAPVKSTEKNIGTGLRSTMNAPSTRPATRPREGSGAEDDRQRRELVRSRLEAYKFYPASARRRGIEGEVELGFALDSKGLADGLMILASSGYSILDRAAMQTVHRAQPFPILGGRYRVRLRFRRL